jgi:dTMP kinase
VGIPGVDPASLSGHLIVIEGADGSGRSTQTELLQAWLERLGHAVMPVGLKRSGLVGAELAEAMKGNTLAPITMSLFYATDFADQLEKSIVPSLRSGFVVLADRYIYTLMARAMARGVDRQWVRDVFGIAPVPDVVFHLDVPPQVLAERSFRKLGSLDYWESGMDIQRSGNLYECFIRYQRQIRQVFRDLAPHYGFITINGNRSPKVIARELREGVGPVLDWAGADPEAAQQDGAES